MEAITSRSVVPEAEEILGKYFPVLDHGFVCLKDYMGGDEDIVEAARVSYGAGTRKKSDTRGLLRYLMRHRHTSPFEQVELKFHVGLPIFVARQLVRHRTAQLNEYSLRYSLPVMQFYVPDFEVTGTQSKKNRQGRVDLIDEAHYHRAVRRWTELQAESKELYELLVSKDVDMARELARMHLPLSMYTFWIWKIDLHNLFHFLGLRCDSHAQWEIQQISNIKGAMAKRVAPLAFEAWLDYRYKAEFFSAQEMSVLRQLIVSSEDSLHQGGTGHVFPEDMRGLGMSEREVNELLHRFAEERLTEKEDTTKFDLDLSSAKQPVYFFEQAKKYLPREL